MTDQNAVDPDATPPFGIVGATKANRFLRSGKFWITIIVGVVLAGILLTLVISLS